MRKGLKMKRKQFMAMIGAMALAFCLGAVPTVQTVFAAQYENITGQETRKQGKSVAAATVDLTKKGSITIRKYDMTAAEAAGDYEKGKDASTGEQNVDVEQTLKDYAIEGVQFSCLRVGNVETHMIHTGSQSFVELVYEIPVKLADILGLKAEDAVDMTTKAEAYPCDNTEVYHYTSQQISDAAEQLLAADNISAKNALEQYLYDYGTLDDTNDQTGAAGVINLPKTDVNGKTTAEDLALGLYLFVETEVPEQVTDTVNPWFVQLPFTNAVEGNEWLYDMVCYPKNQTGNPTLDKSVRNAYSNTVPSNQQYVSGTDKNTMVHVGEDYISQCDSESLIVYNKNLLKKDHMDLNDETYVANRGGYTRDGLTAGMEGAGYSEDFSYRDTTTASEGDILDYILVSKLPHITSSATYLSEYTFTDTLSAGIKYNGDVKIAFYDNAVDANVNNTKNAVRLWRLDSGDYSQDYVDVTVQDPDTGAQVADGSTRMKIRLTEDGLRVLNGAETQTESLSDYYMVVYYTATVKSDASVVTGDEGNMNNVNLIWSRTSDGYYNMLEDRNYVYTYGVDLTKTFSDQKGDFSKVEFTLSNQTDGYYVVAEKASGEDGTYYVTGKTVDEKKATVFVPNKETGRLWIEGVEADRYLLTEIATDHGYNLLRESVEIDIQPTDRDVIASVAGVTGMDEAAMKHIVENYHGGIYDENGNLVTAQTDEIYGNAVNNTVLENANGHTIGKTDMYVGAIKKATAKVDQVEASMTDADAAVILAINNTKKFLLPQTGGRGLYVITIIGMICVAGGSCLITRKREIKIK